MQGVDVQRQFHLMQREIEAAASLNKETKLDLLAAIDSLRIEIEVLKTFIERQHPGFSESYGRLREESVQAIDPEWIG
jgi:hypothetical protein